MKQFGNTRFKCSRAQWRWGVLPALALLALACSRQVTVRQSDPTTRPTLLVSESLEPQRPIPGYVPGVENFGFVSKDLWRGAKPTPEGFHALSAMGVRTIIDLQEEDESAGVPAGVTYVPIRVSSLRADEVNVQAVLAAIDASEKPVFIHCLQGRDRTGLAVAAYRLRCGMPANAAIEELNNFGINFWWRRPVEQRIRLLSTGGR